MPTLKMTPAFETLIKDAQGLQQHLESWINKPAFIRGAETISTALKAGDYHADIFSESRYPEYALVALSQQSITLSQFTTVMMVWAASEDFNASIKQYHLHDNKSRPNARAKLKQFLKSRKQGNSRIPITDDQLNEVCGKLQSDEVPLSEQCFFTFTVHKHDYDFNSSIYNGIISTGFLPFMPIQKGEYYEFIIPSSSLFEAYNTVKASHPIRAMPNIGATPQTGVLSLHERDEHPLGLSFPGYEHDRADGFESGRFGFIIHDIYHIGVMINNPVRSTFNEIARKGVAFAETLSDEHKESFLDSLGYTIDTEVALFQAASEIQQVSSNALRPSHELIIATQLSKLLMKSREHIEAQSEQIKQAIMSRLPEPVSDEQLRAGHKLSEVNRQFIQDELPLINDKLKALFLSPISNDQIEFCRRLLADFINNATLWQTRFGIQTAKILQTLCDRPNIMQYELDDYTNKDGLFSQPSDSESEIVDEQALYLESFTRCEAKVKQFASELVNLNQSSLLTQAGVTFVKDYHQYKQAVQTAIINDDDTALANLLQHPLFSSLVRPLSCDLAYPPCQPEQDVAYQIAHHGAVRCLKLINLKKPELSICYGEHKTAKTNNKSIEFGTTLLHVAAKRAHAKLIETLIAMGAPLNVYDMQRCHPLTYCLRNGCTEGAIQLINRIPLSAHYLNGQLNDNELPQQSRDLLIQYRSLVTKLDKLSGFEKREVLQSLAKRYPFSLGLPFDASICHADDNHSTKNDSQTHESDYQIVGQCNSLLHGFLSLLVSAYDPTMRGIAHAPIDQLVVNIQYLISLGADVNTLNYAKHSPLTEMLKQAAHINAQIHRQSSRSTNADNEASPHAQTPPKQLSSFIRESGHLSEALTILTKSGAALMSAGKGALLTACQQTDLELVQMLLSHHPDRIQLIQQNAHHLLIACIPKATRDNLQPQWSSEHVALFKYLVEHGADLNTSFTYNHSGLISLSQTACVTTAWCFIREYNRVHLPPALRKFCVDHHADLHAIDSFGQSELTLAIMHHSEAPRSEKQAWRHYLDQLNQRGIDLNWPSNGKTPLHTAVKLGNSECIKWLLDKGADRSLKDYQSRTPEQYAKSLAQDQNAQSRSDDNDAKRIDYDYMAYLVSTHQRQPTVKQLLIFGHTTSAQTSYRLSAPQSQDDIDPDRLKTQLDSLKDKIVHYLNLDKTEIKHLLKSIKAQSTDFDPVDIAMDYATFNADFQTHKQTILANEWPSLDTMTPSQITASLSTILDDLDTTLKNSASPDLIRFLNQAKANLTNTPDQSQVYNKLSLNKRSVFLEIFPDLLARADGDKAVTHRKLTPVLK